MPRSAATWSGRELQAVGYNTFLDLSGFYWIYGEFSTKRMVNSVTPGTGKACAGCSREVADQVRLVRLLSLDRSDPGLEEDPDVLPQRQALVKVR
jgi:hypothetical protein